MKHSICTILVLLLLSLVQGCYDLDIENKNTGNIDNILMDPQTFDGIVDEQFRYLFLADNDYYPLALSTMGDGLTTAWGGWDWGWIELSSEPRVAIKNNVVTFQERFIEEPWNNYYTIVNTVNDVLRQYAQDPSISSQDSEGNDITYQVKAKAKFIQGAAYGSLSKLYDKAKIVDESIDISKIDKIDFSPYYELADQAVQMLEQAITEANSGADFQIYAWNGLSISRDDFVKICRSFQAKILVQNSRSDSENNDADWSEIAAYAASGVSFDLAPHGDGGENWYSNFLYQGNEAGWAKADMRLVSMLDPTQPTRFPTDGTMVLGEATFLDARGDMYWNYEEAINFRPERGYYRFSHYVIVRYEYYYPEKTGLIPYFSETENNLILAEALIRSNGDKTQAASLVNETRVNIGGLSELTGSESDDDLLEALFHERFIELLTTSPGTVYFDRRRLPEDNGIDYGSYTGLLPCTPRNIPIPADELERLQLPLYTFGGCD